MGVHAGSTACPSLPKKSASSRCPGASFYPGGRPPPVLVSNCHSAVLMVFCLPCLPGPKRQPGFGSSKLSADKSVGLKACCWFSSPAPCFLTHSDFLQCFNLHFCTSAAVAQSAKQGYKFCLCLLNISPKPLISRHSHHQYLCCEVERQARF